MVDADAAVNLVMDAYFFIEAIAVAGKLHPVHPHVGTTETWFGRAL